MSDHPANSEANIKGIARLLRASSREYRKQALLYLRRVSGATYARMVWKEMAAANKKGKER